MLQHFLLKNLPNLPTPLVPPFLPNKSNSLERSTALDKSCLGKAGMALVGGYGNDIFSFQVLISQRYRSVHGSVYELRGNERFRPHKISKAFNKISD